MSERSNETEQKLSETFAAYVAARKASDRVYIAYRDLRATEAQVNAAESRVAAAHQAHLDAIQGA